MRIAIFGAGAIGSYLGLRLHQGGAQVSLIARGAHLAAILEKGLTLKSGAGTETARIFATGDSREAGPQDCVFVSLKAQALPGALDDILPLLGPETLFVTAMNGMPFWYFHGLDSPWRGRVLESVDPGGRLLRQVPAEHIIGSVLYPWAEIVAPGTVEQSASNRIILGRPDGKPSPRLEALARLMTASGLDAPITHLIRSEIWIKLWGNLSLNPLSALTGATVDRLCGIPELRNTARMMMEEARGLAAKLGVEFTSSTDARLDIAGAAGARKTSMLQDLERGRPLEIEPLLGAVMEIAAWAGEPMPLCGAILALVRERALAKPILNPHGAGPRDAWSVI
jgi:2-dehydropantoate 2-reductase